RKAPSSADRLMAGRVSTRFSRDALWRAVLARQPSLGGLLCRVASALEEFENLALRLAGQLGSLLVPYAPNQINGPNRRSLAHVSPPLGASRSPSPCSPPPFSRR